MLVVKHHLYDSISYIALSFCLLAATRQEAETIDKVNLQILL